jgi:hypothetical protein
LLVHLSCSWPLCARHILNFLRDGTKGFSVAGLGLSTAELTQLRREAEYYEIAALVKLLSSEAPTEEKKKEAKDLTFLLVQASPDLLLLIFAILDPEGFTVQSVSVTESVIQQAVLLGSKPPSAKALAAIEALQSSLAGHRFCKSFHYIHTAGNGAFTFGACGVSQDRFGAKVTASQCTL